MNPLIQNLGKRVFYTARRSATLRRIVAMPLIANAAHRVSVNLLRPMPGYPQWIAAHVIARADRYACAGEPGLLSFLTTVWNTPLPLLKPAVESLLSKQTVRDFEWIVLDNGSTDCEVIEYLKRIAAADPRVILLRAENNLGIVGGMHLVLSKATGRYVLPYDSDDVLYPDLVAIVTHALQTNHYPKILYTDEDKLEGNEPGYPYFKPDWDPVLLLNSCYIAHLDCFDRQIAQQLGVYTDPGCNGCHDWDTFTRFMLAGHKPLHIPEIVYSWRMHNHSTAANPSAKNYVVESQRNLLTRYLKESGLEDRFEVGLNPLFQRSPHWWIKLKSPQTDAAMPTLKLQFDDESDIRSILPDLEKFSGLVFTTHNSVQLTTIDWQAEAVGLFERFPDTAMIGGQVQTYAGRIVEAGRVPGFAGAFGCPDRGSEAVDPGMGTQLWKQHSVSGVSACLCIMRSEFLRQVLEEFKDQPITWNFLGAWAALSAWRHNQRIVYTPFITGICNRDLDATITRHERECFVNQAGDFIPDHRYYSRYLGMTQELAYIPTN
jgi:hypothetical protein